MQHILAILSLLALSFSNAIVNAQNTEGLTQDAKGRYFYSHTCMVPNASKEMLYERLKAFVVEDLNASDTYMEWDEQSRDSIVTIAFFELPNSEDITNQVIDCKARIDFSEGAATLKLSGFNYSVTAGDHVYARPMHRLDPIPYYAQSYGKIALGETLQQLAARMDAMAAKAVSKKAGGQAVRKHRVVKRK
jgi:hypothetical protein